LFSVVADNECGHAVASGKATEGMQKLVGCHVREKLEIDIAADKIYEYNDPSFDVVDNKRSAGIDAYILEWRRSCIQAKRRQL